MLRRLIAAGLLGGGVLLLVRALHWADDDPRRGTALLVIVAGGMVLNLVSVLRRHLALRGWLRNLAWSIALVLLVAVLLLRREILVGALPDVPNSDMELRRTLQVWVETLARLATTVGYVALSIAVLPRPKLTGSTRIDDRTVACAFPDPEQQGGGNSSGHSA